MSHAIRLGYGRSVASPRVVITMPAYKAEATLAKTIADIPAGVADQLILVDDASPDNTAQLARDLGVEVHVHADNRGYGGNQKTCYRMALASGADIVVMLHPDYQYEPRAVPLLIAPILAGDADMTFGSRFAGLSDPRAGGMPLVRYAGNRLTTVVENVLLGSRFSEMHSGMRAYTRRCLLSLPFLRYSDDFLFDSQLLIDAVTTGQRVVEVPIPTRYTDESSSIGTLRSLSYVTRSVAYCARRVAGHGRRRHRSPIGRRDAQSPARGPGEARERSCLLCGAVRPHRATSGGRMSECTACGLVSWSDAPQATATSGTQELGSRIARHALSLLGGYATAGDVLRAEGVSDSAVADAARAAGWRATPSGDAAGDAVLLLALARANEPFAGLESMRAMVAPEGIVALLAPVARPTGAPLDPAVPYAVRAHSLDEALGAAGFRLVEWSHLTRDAAREYMSWLVTTPTRDETSQEVAFIAARPEPSGSSERARRGRGQRG